jgi:microcystin-dependent protein
MSLEVTGVTEYSNLLVVSEWTEELPQIETSWNVLGGSNGAANVHAKVLGNRTQWLKDNKADKNGNAANKFKVATAEADDEAVNKAQAESIASAATVTAGTVVTFATATVPNGYLECNGAELSRTTYASLFAVIGTTYGVGNGSTTFNIPDLRGEFIRGFDNGRGVDSGRTIGTSQGDAIRNITGSIDSQYAWHSTNFSATGAFSSITRNGYMAGISGTGYGVNFNASNVVPTADENRPRNIAMMYCIKY